MLAQAFPSAPLIVVITDNGSIHHAAPSTATPALEVLYGAGTARMTTRWTGLGRAEELSGQHRCHLARPK
jgi:hypothetical protein